MSGVPDDWKADDCEQLRFLSLPLMRFIAKHDPSGQSIIIIRDDRVDFLFGEMGSPRIPSGLPKDAET